ncbi:hypothetical protein V492_00628 [Pseudogymnoascus sp. VKM F-4246]|nr:hypothetical protein V492_00628 [Pseudogymnoascus sp. VKM F-4246]
MSSNLDIKDGAEGEMARTNFDQIEPDNNKTKNKSDIEKPPMSLGPPSGPPPDGGLVAWLQVAAGFMIFFNTWGIINTILAGIAGARLLCRHRRRLALYAYSITDSDVFMGLAIGIASSGSSLGGVIYPIVLYKLLGEIGFPWAVRVIGFIALATFILPLAVMQVRVRAPKPRALIDWSAFVDMPFIVFTLGLLFAFIGNSVLIFYVSFYPQDSGFTDQSLSFYMVSIFNAGSVLGRIVPNALSDRIGVFNTMAPTTLLLGVTIYCMRGVLNAAGMIVLSIVTGFLSGVVVALPPVCFRVLTENKSMIGTRVGQGFAIAGLGLLIGGPSAGAILGGTQPLEWTGVWVFGGTTGVIGAFIFFIVRFMKAGFTLNIKA